MDSLQLNMNSFQIHGTKLQVSQATRTIMETLQLNFKPHATYEQ